MTPPVAPYIKQWVAKFFFRLFSFSYNFSFLFPLHDEKQYDEYDNDDNDDVSHYLAYWSGVTVDLGANSQHTFLY